MEKVKAGKKEMTVEEKLQALFRLQSVDSEVDKIKILRGELPLEVQDLEDEVEGLETRIGKLNEEVNELDKAVKTKQNEIVESQALIKKYEDQQNNVRNNREYDSLSKEIEYQTLEIELCDKKIKEFSSMKDEKKEVIDESKKNLEELKNDLENKSSELESIIEDTRKEEETLVKESEKISDSIEERLLSAYRRIRQNARNGLAVVPVQRDACGGCFNQIPPQRQLDIKSRKKIIVCEYCGRILVDDDILDEEK
ncbi:MAG TPA: C4-type zinc ribbon domain-containing protein [Bacteroidales bacterium]|nr:C4-type zinc ribbon domain-containing protein [Bacteroidales bacterium]